MGSATRYLVTDAGGLAEFVDDGRTGYVVPLGSEDVVCKGIDRFFGEAGEVNFRENIRKQVRENKLNEVAKLFDLIVKLTCVKGALSTGGRSAHGAGQRGSVVSNLLLHCVFSNRMEMEFYKRFICSLH